MLNKLLLLLMLCFMLAACQPKDEFTEFSGKTMGTRYVVKYLRTGGHQQSQALQVEVDKRLHNINRQMSTYDPQSEISRFNHQQNVQQPMLISTEFMQVIREAKRIHQLTEGGLDITVGSLVNLWGFGPTKSITSPPDPAAIRQHLEWTGMDKLLIGETAISKTISELSLDLSAIAKGYAVDVIGEYLESQGISNYLVDIGGEIRARGVNQDHPWRVAIEKPETSLSPQIQRIIELNNLSMATSGNYRNYFEYGGVRYSHTIDPKTGWPVDNTIASITVLTPSCMTADGFATGLGVMSPQQILLLADELNLAVYLLVNQDNHIQERYSNAFARLMDLAIQNQPTL